MTALLSASALTLMLCVTTVASADGAAARRTAPVARKAAVPATPAAPRRLDDIHIEGEIPVPQVLFVSVREQRRFLDFRPSRYLRTARQLGEATPVPVTVVSTTSPVTRAEETHR